MIATFFEWRIHEGKEQQFRKAWSAVTKLLHPSGSHGSALFRNDKGHLCAVAAWPDRETRDAAFAPYLDAPTDHHLAMRDAVAETFHRMDLDCLENLWRLPDDATQD